MKYAHLENNTKKLLGWYSDDVHNAIPIDSIVVEDEIWQEAININANCYENGKFIVKDFRTAKEIEKQRVLSIKSKAGEIIINRYSIVWQLNHPRIDETYKAEYEWIDKIREISNKAELEGTAMEDINWDLI